MRGGSERCWVFVVVVLVLMGPALARDCTTPTDGMTLTNDTLLCAGVYEFPSGFKIVGAHANLDCNKAVFVGTGSGVGLTMSGEIVTAKACTFANYDEAIRLEDADVAKLFGNTLANSSVGLKAVRTKYFAEFGNVFVNNGQDKVVEDVVDAVPEMPPVLIANAVSDELLQAVKVSRADHNAASSLVSILRSARVGEGRTTVFVDVIANADVELEVIEHVPKGLALSMVEVDTSVPPVRIVNDDPDFVMYVGRVKIKNKLSFNYTLDKEASKEQLDQTATVVSRRTVAEELVEPSVAVPPVETPVEQLVKPVVPSVPVASPSRTGWLVAFVLGLVLLASTLVWKSKKRNHHHGQPPSQEEL